LILAIIAIFYAIISNNRGSEQFSKIDGKTNDLVNAAETTTVAADKISVIADDLGRKVPDIISRLESISSISEESKANIQAINKKLDERQEEMSVKRTGNERSKNKLDSASWVMLLLLYAANLSKEKNKSFKLTDVFYEASKGYTHGVLVACSALGIINYVMDDVNGPIKINSIDSDITKQLPTLIEDRLKGNLARKEHIEKIDNFFNSK
jgi:hypothetical protein